ncbi:MAG TPA: PEP-CTERM sorting domain-containing protein [Verrucomicrobiae bacterium]|nr:PEP-CTERM sorting domain-containing protein [Verrucomicrobiae bacterium]
MRKTLWVITVLALLAAIGAPVAMADSTIDYSITFIATTGSNVTGSYIWDSTTDQITSFTITTTQFGTINLLANEYPGYETGTALYHLLQSNGGAAYGWGYAWGPSAPPTAWFMQVYNQPYTTTYFYAANDSLTSSTTYDSGSSWSSTLSSISTPEPGTFVLLLLGIGFVFVMRKRIGQDLPQAT